MNAVKLSLIALTSCALLLPNVAAFAANPTPVYLGAANPFVILSETGITDVSASSVTGWVGTTPITGAADHLSCSEVTGRIYAVDATGPAPCSIKAPKGLANALAAVKTAYANASARVPDVNELGAGNIGGLTLAPGVYRWSSAVIVPSSVTLSGKAKDVWIFQIAQTLDVAAGTSVILAGGASARNVFWQVAGKVTLGTTAHFNGTILAKTLIAVKTGASVNGRLYSQTAVTLQQNAVTISVR
jgi:hypothetical protein